MNRCNDCAFTIGTGASRAPATAVIAKLCTLTGERFDCHVEIGPCVGWSEEVAERKRKGGLLEKGTDEYKTAKILTELMMETVRLADSEHGSQPGNAAEEGQ